MNEQELLKAVKHDTLKAINNGENYLKSLGGKADRASEMMRDSTERLVKHLKEELERWDSKNKKAKVS